jgi:hypothetical protein
MLSGRTGLGKFEHETIVSTGILASFRTNVPVAVPETTV